MGMVDLNYWEEKRAGLLNVVFLETRYNRGVIPKRPSSRDRSLINVILNENEWTIRCCERKQAELDPIIEMEHRIKWDLNKKRNLIKKRLWYKLFTCIIINLINFRKNNDYWDYPVSSKSLIYSRNIFEEKFRFVG